MRYYLEFKKIYLKVLNFQSNGTNASQIVLSNYIEIY